MVGFATLIPGFHASDPLSESDHDELSPLEEVACAMI